MTDFVAAAGGVVILVMVGILTASVRVTKTSSLREAEVQPSDGKGVPVSTGLAF